VRIFQGAEARVIFEPVAVVLGERFECAAQRSVGGFGVALVRAAENLIFEFMCFAKIDFSSSISHRIRPFFFGSAIL